MHITILSYSLKMTDSSQGINQDNSNNFSSDEDNFSSDEDNFSSSENETRIISTKKEKRTTSWIWEYFEIISNEKARCSFCR